MNLIGADPGLSGGIAVLNDSGGVLHYQKMPVKPILDEKQEKTGKKIIDIGQVAAVIARFEPEYVFIEKVHAMPGQGVSSMFSFGMGYGMLLGLTLSLEAMLHTELVTPQKWQKFMYAQSSFPEGISPKGKALITFRELWPKLAADGVSHDGIVDAMLLAEFARRTLRLQ